MHWVMTGCARNGTANLVASSGERHMRARNLRGRPDAGFHWAPGVGRYHPLYQLLSEKYQESFIEMRQLKVALWGAWYGSRNIGDLTVLITLTELLRTKLDDAQVTVLSNNAAGIEQFMQRQDLPVNAINKWRQFPKTLHALATHDLFLIGGGVPFYDHFAHVLVFP